MIGWIQLSRQAVAQAEQALHGDERGVRDEIGFLVLHQAFADHFFPGTSVLHTRLKYALFVPWLIQASGGDEKKLNDLELRLQMRLAKADPEGGGGHWGQLEEQVARPACFHHLLVVAGPVGNPGASSVGSLWPPRSVVEVGVGTAQGQRASG